VQRLLRTGRSACHCRTPRTQSCLKRRVPFLSSGALPIGLRPTLKGLRSPKFVTANCLRCESAEQFGAEYWQQQCWLALNKGDCIDHVESCVHGLYSEEQRGEKYRAN
jgi:hypothetical protein